MWHVLCFWRDIMDRRMLFRNVFMLDTDGYAINEETICNIIVLELFRMESALDGYSLKDIHDIIEKCSDLEYTLEEIDAIICSQSQYFCIDDKDKISLSSTGFEFARELSNKKTILHFLRKFSSIPDYNFDITFKEITDIVYKYFYSRFEEDFSAISKILQKEPVLVIEDERFNDNEKEVINAFLSWDNDEKNKCVFDTLSLAIDFCYLTNKEDSNQFIFEDWDLYLDTNLFFRLVGLNNANRMQLLDRFVVQARKAKVHLKYTSFTEKEIILTLSNKIDILESFCKDYSIIAPSAAKKLLLDSVPFDLYCDYYEWIKKNPLRNYAAYKKDLIQKCRRKLSEFEKDDECVSFFEQPRNYEIGQLRKSLQECAEKKSDVTCQHDINNILHLRERNKSKKAKCCFITADHNVVKWADNVFPMENLAALPSVWHSLFLKYCGRTTTQDYEAFCKFISLPIKREEDFFGKDKPELWACIQEITNDADLKEEIIYELINNKSKYEGYPKVLERVNKAAENVIDNAKRDAYNHGIKDSQNASEKEMQKRLQANNSEWQKRIQYISDINREIGSISTRIVMEENFIEKKANKKKLLNTLIGVLILIAIILAVLLSVRNVLFISKIEFYGFKINDLISMLLTVGAVLLGLCKMAFGLIFQDAIKIIKMSVDEYREYLVSTSVVLNKLKQEKEAKERELLEHSEHSSNSV